MRTRTLLVICAFILVAAACGGSSSDPATTTPLTAAPTATTPPPTTATPATTSTAAPLETTTTGAPTTTTSSAPLPDPAQVLAALNQAMAAGRDFLATSIAIIKETEDTPDASAYVTQQVIGGGVAGGDGWQLINFAFATPGLTQTLVVRRRTVAGVVYEQNSSGIWEIDTDPSQNPIEDTLSGVLVLDDLSIERNANRARVSGSYPADPAVRQVTVEIDKASGLLLSLVSVTDEPRARSTNSSTRTAIRSIHGNDSPLRLTASMSPRSLPRLSVASRRSLPLRTRRSSSPYPQTGRKSHPTR